MREIMLTQGKVALVDDEDYEMLMKYKWHALCYRSFEYAGRTTSRLLGRQHSVNMHWEILRYPKGKQCDHVDGNGLNNQRSNLRVVSVRGNAQNKHFDKTSKYSGVCKKGNSWRSTIYFKGKHRHIGTFKREIDAASAYRVACAALVGEDVVGSTRCIKNDN